MRLGLAILTVLLASLLAPSIAGQGRVQFDRRAHLEAYEEITFSEFVDLYELAPFTEAEGKLVDQERLAELRRAWADERARVADLLEAERADPRRWSLFLLDRALASHAFFAQISWTRIDDVDGLVVYVQTPKKDDPAYAPRVARDNVARLAPLRAFFAREIAAPAGLVRRDDFGAEVLFVLASTADAQTYARLVGASAHYRSFSFYDAKLRAAVVFEDPFDRQTKPEDKAHAARHAFAHLLLHEHEQKLTTPLQEDWLREGLASWLADVAFDLSGEPAPTPPPVGTLRELVAATQRRSDVLTHFHRVDDLYALPTYSHVVARAQVEAKRAGRDPWKLDMQGISMCYWRESLMLVDYLMGTERRAGFLALLADELRGDGGAAALHRAFPATDPAAFDRAFLDHLYAEHRRLVPGTAIDDGGIAAVLKQDASLAPIAAPPPGAQPGASGVAGASDGAGAQAAAAPPFEPKDLAPRDLGPEAELALCLDLARRGRSAEAESRLAAVLSGELGADLHARITRAKERIAAWNRLRTAWFESLVASGASYRFEHDGKTARAEVERVEDGFVHLAENRAGALKLALDELDPIELAKAIGNDADALPDGWARALPYALGDTKRAKRMLDERDPAQASLLRDLDGDLPVLTARGFPLGELELLSRVSIPRDPAGCEDVLARLGAVVRDHGDTSDVAAMRPMIRAYARLALAVVFDLKGLPQLVHGEWEALPGGRVRLSYGFEEAAELADFTRDDGYLERRHHELGELAGDDAEVRIDRGALVGFGAATLRHRLGFQAPMAVSYDLSFEETKELGTQPIWFFLLGICARGPADYAGAVGRIDLEVCEGRDPVTAYSDERVPMYQRTRYRVELAHDGETVRLALDGAPMQSLPCRGLTAGGLFLLFHSDLLVRVDQLVIEGAIDEQGAARARDAWIEERIDERGL